MKTKFSIFSPHFWGILLSFFCLNFFSLPTSYSIINLNDFQLTTNQLGLSISAIFVILLFSTACAVIIYMLTRTRDVFLSFCAALLVADPLFRCCIINVKYLVLFAVAVALCIYLIVGKSLKIKTILVAFFASFSVLIYSESVCCHIPVVILVYGFNWLSEEDVSEKTIKYTDRKKSGIQKDILKTKIGNIALLVIPFALSIFIKEKLLNEDLFRFSIVYQNIGNLFIGKNFWFAVIPYFCLLLIFITLYFSIKTKDQKHTWDIVKQKIKFIGPVLISLFLVALGKFAFGYNTGATVINLICSASMILMYLNDRNVSSQLVGELSKFWRKHKLVLCVVAAAWFFGVQYLFIYTQRTIIDSIVSVVGNRL